MYLFLIKCVNASAEGIYCDQCKMYVILLLAVYNRLYWALVLVNAIRIRSSNKGRRFNEKNQIKILIKLIKTHVAIC